MLRLFVVLLAVLLTACGGEEKKTVYVEDTTHSNDTEFKVLVKGYPGTLTVVVNSTGMAITGETVTSLGYFPQGSEASIVLADVDSNYECFPPLYPILLTDLSQTLVIYCTPASDPSDGPLISYLSWPSEVSLFNAISVYVQTLPMGSGALLGYTMVAISAPEGATVTQLTENTSTSQKLSVDMVGDYVIEIRAHAEYGVSAPRTIEFTVVDYPPHLWALEFINDEIYTDTDIDVTVAVSNDGPDTPTIYFQWTINNVPVDGVSDSTLSASLFSKGDVIGVEAFAEDAHNLVSTGPISLTVKDSPGEIEVTSLPASINRGDTLDISVTVTDKDAGDAVTAAPILAYGPPGMSIDAGQLTWTADQILLSGAGTFIFGVAPDNTPALVKEFSIEVLDTASQTTEITGVLPSQQTLRKHMMFYDYDNDGTREMLVASTRSLGIYDYDTGALEWAYIARQDFFGDIRDAVFVPQPSGETLIAVLSENVILIDPASKKEVARLNIAPYTQSGSANGITYAQDASGDGLILAMASSSYYQQTLIAFDAVTHERRWNTLNGRLGSISLVGNFDSDPQDEIITGDGYVFDLETGQNQWIHSFSGNLIALEVGSLGRKLVIANYGGYREIAVTDVELKTTTVHSITSDYVYDLFAADIDNDGSGELALAVATELRYYDYDPDTQAFSETSSETLNRISGMSLVEDLPVAGQNTLVAIDNYDHFISSRTLSVDTAWREQDLVGCRLAPALISIASTTPVSEFGLGSCGYRLSFLTLDASATLPSLPAAGRVEDTARLFGLIDNDSNPDVIFTDYRQVALYDSALGTATVSLPADSEPDLVRAADINEDGSKELFSASDQLINIYDLAASNIVQQLPASTAGPHSYYRRIKGIDSYVAADKTYVLAVTEADVRVFESVDGALVQTLGKAYNTVYSARLADTDDDNIPEVIIHHSNGLTVQGLDNIHRFTNPVQAGTTILGIAPPHVSKTGYLFAYSPQYPTRLSGIDLQTGKTVWAGPIIYSMTSAAYFTTPDGDRLIISSSGGVTVGK